MFGSGLRLWASGSRLRASGTSSPAMRFRPRPEAWRPKPALFIRCKKVIVRCVVAFRLGIFARFVAGIVSGLSAVCVNALDLGDLRQSTFSRIAHYIHEEPRDGIRIE